MNHNQLLDQASEFILDTAGVFVLRRWTEKPFWVICDTWSYAQFLTMEGKWENRKEDKAWLDSVLWSEPLAAANFYYGWRSQFYWIYVKGNGDRIWYYQLYSKDRGKTEAEYFALQSKRPTLHWLLIGPDRKILREDVGDKKQEWIEYPRSIDPSVYLEKS